MSLEQLFQSVESTLYNFGRQLCHDPRDELVAEADDLAEELRRQEAHLQRCREEIAEVREQLKAYDARAGFLSGRVRCFLCINDGPNAYQHAIELDEVRRRVAEGRRRMRQALGTERDCLQAIGALEARLAALHEKLAGK